MNDYRNLKLQYDNIDIYFPLKQKVNLIEKLCPKYCNGIFLDLGCGKMPYKNLIEKYGSIAEYIGVDIENPIYQKEIKPDIFWNGSSLPLSDNSIDSSMLIEVLEHVPKPIKVLSELRRVLKSQGTVIITVPFLWNLHDVPFDEYRYTPFSLKRILEESGFEVERMEAFGGWHSSMATMLALYARRALRGRKRKYMSKLIKPVVTYLNKKDIDCKKDRFKSGSMITGLWCVAKAVN